MEVGMLLSLAVIRLHFELGSWNFKEQTGVCTEYEQLLHECQDALETWRRRRDEVTKEHLTGKEIGYELQKLQANYAKAYSNLNRHDKECELCQFVSKIGERQFPVSSSHVLDRSHVH
jgi:hypothetical protein